MQTAQDTPAPLRWWDHLALNIYALGLSISAGAITPVLLPYLIALFVAQEQKNSYLATVRVAGLAVAMLVQPLAGMFSDRSTHPWGRRRPFIAAGTLLDLVFLLVIGASPLLVGSPLDDTLQARLGFSSAYGLLLLGIILLQASSNLAQGAFQGLMPDLVPPHQRGFSSGVKSVMELLPAVLVIFIGPLVDAGRVWLTVGIIGGSLTLTTLITLAGVRERPLTAPPRDDARKQALRLLGLTFIFVSVTQAGVRLVRLSGLSLTARAFDLELQVGIMGLAGLAAMAGAIFAGVYLGAWVGIGERAREQRPFIWWVINRLLFLAAVGSIQGFAQFYLADVLKVTNPATATTILLAVVALFLLPSALGGGRLADRYGRRRLVGAAGLGAFAGTLLLLSARSFPLVVVSGCIIGLATGVFMATSWALGTELAPPREAGRYLGISNLAGAGAGIVGAGIGGPMADFFNRLNPGLGYLVIFAIYAALFLLSATTLRFIPETWQTPT